MESKIFIGPTYYQRLEHMVKNKIYSRSIGPKEKLTKQPVKGRQREGALRIGEMERDGILAHGASDFIKERFMECSDKHIEYVCDNCGLIAIANPDENIYGCGCGSQNISRMEIPYATKLLLQEIMTMSIAPRIVSQ